ncbi:hypothetical protein GB937_008431 [Aspergillus fischeri]|nr:hypothetical protein GB937_008431 [Aspergillus fischeri]
MELLRMPLRPHLVRRDIPLQHTQRRRQIHPLLRLDVHLATQRRSQFQLHPAERLFVAVCLRGHADRARERKGVGGMAAFCGIAVGVVEVELVEDPVEVGGVGVGCCAAAAGLDLGLILGRRGGRRARLVLASGRSL